MFSGIVEDIGTVVATTPQDEGMLLRIKTAIEVAAAGEAGVGSSDRERIGLGDSIAINGVCLTVEQVNPPQEFAVLCGRETLLISKLRSIAVGSRVNLERALRVGDRLDGHMVQGHVDGIGTVVSLTDLGETWILWVEFPPDLARYIAIKGSISIDGVSLTVNELSGHQFRCNIIPYTIEETALGLLKRGSLVNLEVDVIARYLERLMSAPSPLNAERLRALGFASQWSRGGSK